MARKSAKKLSTIGEHRQPTYRDQYRYYQLVIDEIYALIRQHNQRIGLALDPDVKIQRLVGMLATTQQINQAFGLAHGAVFTALLSTACNLRPMTCSMLFTTSC